jgi:magnesium chelatase subunit I
MPTKYPTTLGALKASGYRPRRVRDELRANLMAALRERRPLFQGIIGYEDTVVPQVIHALLAGHNILLLGQRGQAKTRLIRAMAELLDPAIPVIAGSPVPEDPLSPITPTGKRMVEEAGDDLRLEWLTPADRYQEKLATPDVTIADLIGDIDPIKAMARKLDFANEEVIHYGLVPRSNRCVFAINELPDLQPRIQVGLLNILEERDFQIRGFPVRMPIDIFVVFTANPEDYTNRGNIITPLKDRIEAQIITHYPQSLEDGVAITKQEAWRERDGQTPLHVPELFFTLVEQIAIEARLSDYVDRNSGVSARMPISLLETLISAMERRVLLNGDTHSQARICDLYAAIPAITGKVELVYKGEQEGIAQVAEHLVGKAIKERFNALFVPNYKRGRDPKHTFEEFARVTSWFEAGNVLDLDDTLGQAPFEKMLDGVSGLRAIAGKTFPGLKDGEIYCVMEFLLEGLAQNFVLSKLKLVTGRRYADELYAMSKADD